MNSGVFVVRPDSKFVNCLRRTLMSQVPTVAIDTVFIYENNSCIHDEMLAQRLGLVPLDIDPNSIGDDEEIEFTLEAETHRDMKDVLSRELVSDHVKPFLDHIVLTHLDPNQKVRLVAKAKKGTGETHAKWSPITSFRRIEDDKVFIETTGLAAQQVFDMGMALLVP